MIIAILFISIGCSALMMILFFYFQNKKLQKEFSEATTKLNHQITKNKRQIFLRYKNLSNYDFLMYNLNDALIVQPEIIL